MKREGWRSQSDVAVIEGMRAGVAAAFNEFVERYQPFLLSRARQAAMPEWESNDCVAEVLESVALYLIRPEVRPPSKVAGYLARALRNRMVDGARTRASRAASELHAADRSRPSYEGAVTSVASQYALESCQLDSTEFEKPVPPPVHSLLTLLNEALTDEERTLLVWEGNMIPHRTIAQWLGISHSAATKRISRLRMRLRALATAHRDRLEPAAQVEIGRVMHGRGQLTRHEVQPISRVAEHALHGQYNQPETSVSTKEIAPDA